MQLLCANRKKKFIPVKLKEFCEKKDIKIKYAASYIRKKNGIVKQN